MPDQTPAPGYTPRPRGSNTALIVVIVAVALLGLLVCCGGLAFVGFLVPYRAVEQQRAIPEMVVPAPEDAMLPSDPPAVEPPKPAPDSESPPP